MDHVQFVVGCFYPKDLFLGRESTNILKMNIPILFYSPQPKSNSLILLKLLKVNKMMPKLLLFDLNIGYASRGLLKLINFLFNLNFKKFGREMGLFFFEISLRG